jgi:tetratricopeptide (TPR) repeat protein
VADPHETANVVADSPAVADRLGIAMDAMKASNQRVAGTSSDEAAMQRLRSLGYVGVGAPVEAPPDDLADPKSRIALRDTLKEGEGLLRAGNYTAAQAVFANVLASEPDSRYANLRSGIALLRLGRIEESVRILRHAVELEPRRAEARYALGDALMRQMQFAEAVDQWAALAELQPRRKEAWFNLATALEKSGQTDRSKTALEEFHRLEKAEIAAHESMQAQP